MERQAKLHAAEKPNVRDGVEALNITEEPILKPRENVKIVALDLQPM